MSMSGQPFSVGSIKLSNGAVLRLRILIVDIKEMGFSPFGGISFNASQVVSGNLLRISHSSHRGLSSLGMAGNCSVLMIRSLRDLECHSRFEG